MFKSSILLYFIFEFINQTTFLSILKTLLFCIFILKESISLISEHPGSHKTKKSRCEHLALHYEEFTKTNKSSLVVAERVHIHDLFEVKDGRNAVCRLFYLDTLQEGEDDPSCDCRLTYKGESDQLLPVSLQGKDQTFHVVSYRLLLDFFLFKITDGTSESGFINAYNRKKTDDIWEECKSMSEMDLAFSRFRF